MGGGVDPFGFQDGSAVFGDGSAVEPKCEISARGGRAAIETDPEGNRFEACVEVPPVSLPQAA
eukprot:6689066-Pyramimonas_sp.AAC.1